MKYTSKGFAVIGILIATVIVLIVGGIAYYAGTKNSSITKNIEEKIDITQPISVSDAEKLCLKQQSCPKNKVTVIGKLRIGGYINMFSLEGVWITFSPEVSRLQAIKFAEDNLLLKGGSVEVEVTGILSTRSYPINGSGGATGLVMNSIKPEDIKFIKTGECLSKGQPSPIPNPPTENCFNFSNYSIKASDAYMKLLNSKICTKDNATTTNIMFYNENENAWEFQTTLPGSFYCHVSSDKIELVSNP
jgi:hypothetical protein